MIRPPFLPLAALALLAGCSVKTHDANGNETATISFGDGDNASAGDNSSGDNSGGDDGGGRAVSVNVPGFHAKVSLPDVGVSSSDTDIDGITLYPGTKMTGVDVNAETSAKSGGGADSDEDDGHVTIAFSAPATPDQLLAYYKGAARQAGWHEQAPAAGQRFAATKPNDDGKTKHLAIELAVSGPGATGRFLIDDE